MLFQDNTPFSFFSFKGSLALYDASNDGFQLIRMLLNTVVKGDRFGPHVLSVSEDSLQLAFVGPSEYTVTVANARSLDEVRSWGLMWLLGNMVGAVANCSTLFHLCDRSSIFCTHHLMWVEFVVGSSPRVFLWVFQFPFLQKTNTCNFQFDWNYNR